MWLMNSATATAIGTATTIAIVAATSVPKASGQTNLTRLLPSGSSAELAVNAGHAFTTRNRATPASVARMITPAQMARPRKTRSPTTPPAGPPRTTDCRSSTGAALTSSQLLRGSLAAGDGVDGRLDLRPHGVAVRGRAGVLRGRVLAVGADDVVQIGLDRRRLAGVGVLRAGHGVGHQHDRVRAGLGRRAVEVVREDVLARIVGLLGELDDLCGRLGRRADPFLAHLDLRLAERTRLGFVGVADRALAGLHGIHHAGRALRGLAALDRPVLGRLVRPHLRCYGGQVLREILRRARLIGAVDDRDPRVREVGVRVVGLDRRVVPVLDLLLEDLRQRLGRELQVLDAVEVVDHRDRRGVNRDLNEVVHAATALLCGGQLVVLEARVGSAVLRAAGVELLTTAAGPHRVIGDRDVGVRVLEPGDPRLLRGLLGA